MKFPLKVIIPVSFLVLAVVACGFSGNSTNPSAASNNGSSGSDQSSSSGGSSSASGSSSSGYGKVPLPTDTVDFKPGEVYKVGQAIKDPTTGAIFEVLKVSKNNTWPGLNPGETYILIDVLLGNTGSQTYSSSSLGSYMVKAKGSTTAYGLSHILSLLAANVLTNDMGVDLDVAPGEAYHGLLPVAVPADATGLTLQFSPALTDKIGQPFTVDLGQ